MLLRYNYIVTKTSEIDAMIKCTEQIMLLDHVTNHLALQMSSCRAVKKTAIQCSNHIT